MPQELWFVVDFKHKVDESTRTKIKRVLNAIDATERPAVALCGVVGAWGQPPITIVELCDLLHFCGIPCSGFAHPRGLQPAVDDRYESKPELHTRVATVWGRTLWPELIRCGFAILHAADAPPPSPEVADTEPPPAGPLTDLELIARLRGYLPARVADGWLWSEGLPDLCKRFEATLQHTREASEHITSAQAAMNQALHEAHR